MACMHKLLIVIIMCAYWLHELLSAILAIVGKGSNEIIDSERVYRLVDMPRSSALLMMTFAALRQYE